MSQNSTNWLQVPESKSKKFWRVVLGSMVGFLLSYVIIFILSFFFMIFIMAAFTPTTPTAKDHSILKISFPNPIVERSVPNPFEGMDLGSYSQATTGLNDILACIENAATDPKIKGIYLNVPYISAAPATIQEIRNALEIFKESGKFIYAYSDTYSQNGYYISSVADKVVLNAKGDLDFKGYAYTTLFFKGLLEKLDIDMQIIRHGEFKSAIEPFVLDKMSEANREQMTLFVTTVWNSVLTDIQKSRNLTLDNLNEIANKLLCENAKAALELNLVDELSYYPNVEKELKNLSGIQEEDALNFVGLSEYRSMVKDISFSSNDQIAVVYAIGDIVDGKGGDNVIASETFSQQIRKVYHDEKVKAIVLRVNSGGGSALASEVIWNEIEMAKKAGKKVVVSMGDYAASGGYYIACGADAIVAQATTLTGSIGVFGMIPSLQNFFKNKLGVTIDVVKTNDHSDYMSGFRKLDEAEINTLQFSVEDVYSTFIQRVADGRGMTTEEVDKIGQGRIWAGKDALELGLIDKVGRIEDAILLAAEIAGLENYKVTYFPKQKDWWNRLVNPDKDAAIQSAIKEELGDLYFVYSAYQKIMNAQGVQARMPFEIVID